MAHAKESFISKYIFSFDHKMIGKQYFTLAMIMGFIGGILAVLIRLQLGFPSKPWPFLENLFPVGMASGIMTPEFYVSLFTMHGTIMVFFLLSLLPVSGFGNFLIPLQIGARDMAFPFLNMLSFWTVVPGAIIILISFFVEGGAAASGWTAYPPLSAIRSAIPGSGAGQTLWLIGMIFFVASFTMGGLNFVVTILNLRTKGLRMMRMPLTTWAQFVVGILGLLSFPALAAGAILLTFDRSLGTSFFLPAGIFIGDTLMPHEGGTPLLWQHLFWFLGHPEVYIIMLPAMGFTSDVLATFCRRPIFGYRSMVYAIMAIGTLSFLVWGHHMFVSGMSPFLGSLFVVTTLAIAVPSAVKAFNWLFTIAKDIQLHDTYFVVGHFHFIMAGAGLFGAFAAVYFWYPKMFGRKLNERIGKIHFWITFLAYYAVFFPMHYLGVAGMMRRIYDPNVYEYLQPLQPVNLFITISAFVLFAGQLLFLWNYFSSMRRGAPATGNPWDAAGLEWSTPAKPGHGNWEGDIPEVHRWPYDYSRPDRKRDFIPQWEPKA